jgi:hypothetical protein
VVTGGVLVVLVVEVGGLLVDVDVPIDVDVLVEVDVLVDVLGMVVVVMGVVTGTTGVVMVGVAGVLGEVDAPGVNMDGGKFITLLVGA